MIFFEENIEERGTGGDYVGCSDLCREGVDWEGVERNGLKGGGERRDDGEDGEEEVGMKVGEKTYSTCTLHEYIPRFIQDVLY